MGVGESQRVSMETGVAYTSCAPHKGLHHPDKGLIAAGSSVPVLWALPGPTSFHSSLIISAVLQHNRSTTVSKVTHGSGPTFVYLFHHPRIFIPTVNEWFIATLCAFSSSSILTWVPQFLRRGLRAGRSRKQEREHLRQSLRADVEHHFALDGG